MVQVVLQELLVLQVPKGTLVHQVQAVKVVRLVLQELLVLQVLKEQQVLQVQVVQVVLQEL